jgi:hypothetical protein
MGFQTAGDVSAVSQAQLIRVLFFKYLREFWTEFEYKLGYNSGPSRVGLWKILEAKNLVVVYYEGVSVEKWVQSSGSLSVLNLDFNWLTLHSERAGNFFLLNLNVEKLNIVNIKI